MKTRGEGTRPGKRSKREALREVASRSEGAAEGPNAKRRETFVWLAALSLEG